MLRELHISNLAVISDARIELAQGLNCFTGATGAGKSLVIGAIEVLLGLRSTAELLRPGADEGRVSGVFELADRSQLQRIAVASDVPAADLEGQLLITRRLHASGRSSASLNGHPITLNMLKQIAEHLVDVHGQHDHQFLLKPSNQLDVLDQFGNLRELRSAYHAAFLEYQDARNRLDELAASTTLRQQQLELYRFQVDEIDNAQLSAGEYEELQARSAVLKNLERLKKETSSIHAALYEMDGSVLERLRMMAGILAELSDLDAQLKDGARSLRDSAIQLEEVAFDLSRYLDRLDLDPAELRDVEERLNTINRLLNKYEPTVEGTLVYREEIGRKADALARASDDFSSLRQQLQPLEIRMAETGRKLSDARRAAAQQLSPLVMKQLAELGMEKATFSVTFNPLLSTGFSSPPSSGPQSPAIACSPSGIDQIEFTAQTNPGQLAQPLRKIASGGEMSRIMLALKSILADTDRTSVLVFDEIDANVGGRLGSTIGRKLRDLAAHHQVLCITHLSQIASYADRHLTVRKVVNDNRTETTVRVMEGAERIEELAEMIGGQRITDTTRAQARELLDSAVSEVVAPRRSSRPQSKRPQRTPSPQKKG